MMQTTKGDTLRCFVAIEIPQQMQALLKHKQTHLRSKIRKASWTKPENFHLTLKFLGDVHPETLADVREALRRVAEAQTSFSMELGGVGAFPNLNRPRVLWIGVKQGAPTLSRLAKSLNREMRALGFSMDTRFHPHFTLARFRTPLNLEPLEDMLRQYDTIDEAVVSVAGLTLMQSQLHPSGAIYTPLNFCHFSF